MLLIDCPWCGPRSEIEFRCGGQALLCRPQPFDQISDLAWGNYLYMRANPRGVHLERWIHYFGCGQWFHVERHTVTHEIKAVRRLAQTTVAADVDR